MNYLLDLSNQMGLEFTQAGMNEYIPNSTKCMKWQDVKASHKIDHEVIIKMDSIYGLMILLAIGVGGSLVLSSLEYLTLGLQMRLKKSHLNSGEYSLPKFYLRIAASKCTLRGPLKRRSSDL